MELGEILRVFHKELLIYGVSVFGALILLIFLTLVYEKITNMWREKMLEVDDEEE